MDFADDFHGAGSHSNRAIAVATRLFETGVAENEMFEKNLAAISAARVTRFGKLPLIVLSQGVWKPLPGVSAAENQQAWQAWRKMQSELAALSSNSKLIVAEKSGHSIQLQQPQLVIEAIRDAADAAVGPSIGPRKPARRRR